MQKNPFVYAYNINNTYTQIYSCTKDAGVGLLIILEKNGHKEHQHINLVSIRLNMAAPITDTIQRLHPGFHKKMLAMCTKVPSDENWRDWGDSSSA